MFHLTDYSLRRWLNCLDQINLPDLSVQSGHRDWQSHRSDSGFRLSAAPGRAWAGPASLVN